MSGDQKLFHIDKDLEIGTVFEVSGNSLKIALDRKITELSRSYRGRVYAVGQIGSIIKIHTGRKILFATVSLLRLQSDEETAAITATTGSAPASPDRRVMVADLLGEAWWLTADKTLKFKRGISTYPLPLQAVHLITKEETEKLFESVESSRDDGVDCHVPIGDYVGATRVQCRADIDKLFSQHCAVLGSTGSGKSGTVASIIHSVLDHIAVEGQKLRPRIIILDPHGEYTSAFGEKATVFRAYDALAQGDVGASNLNLPYWLMSGDEFRTLVIGKTEFEATSQANTVYKALAHARMAEAGLARSAVDPIPEGFPEETHPQEPQIVTEGTEEETAEWQRRIASFDRDRPLPFRLDEFEAHIRNRQAKRWHGGRWQDKTQGDFQKEYASILDKFRVLRSDPRITFLMSEYDEDKPNLSAIISQFVGIGDGEAACLRIVDISGLPNEVAGPLSGAIARLLFQYKLHQSREERERDPVLLVCEEAHRYVPNRGEAQYSVAQDAIRRIAREGRKYGLGLMLVSQRPSDIEGTVISQCNSWIVLRLSNSADQEHVSRFLPDSLAGMTRMLPSLPRQEALFVGEAAAIPARIKIKSLPKSKLPNSNDISFSAAWSSEPPGKESINEVAGRMQGKNNS